MSALLRAQLLAAQDALPANHTNIYPASWRGFEATLRAVLK